MGGWLWEAGYGRLAMGGWLWEAGYGRLATGGWLWEAGYETQVMVGWHWEASLPASHVITAANCRPTMASLPCNYSRQLQAYHGQPPV